MASPRKTRSAPRETSRRQGMHLCPECSSGMVQPVRWFEQGDRHWHVDLRCPECEWTDRGSFTQDQVDDFDAELDRGCKTLMDDLRTLERANLEEDIDRFVGALEANDILPEDF